MPKLKTKKAASKRFKKTATGKFRYSRANSVHILGKKSPKRKMGLRKQGVVDSTNERAVRKMLPYA
ncbi:MAG: 50S ribosomal protein L35 [Clostridiales bacterium]|jgi:large subunit ribosomal protein L35|nr:50S ribosomal protein L35 [Clostridiales bacterium]